MNITVSKIALVRETAPAYLKMRSMNSPETVVATMNDALSLENEAQEVLACVYLNTKNHVAGIVEVGRGTVNASLASPREIFKGALLHNASALIIVHNHPSGDDTPSREDLNLTQRMCKVGKLMDIPVLDHIIIAGNSHISLREKNPEYFRL